MNLQNNCMFNNSSWPLFSSSQQADNAAAISCCSLRERHERAGHWGRGRATPDSRARALKLRQSAAAAVYAPHWRPARTSSDEPCCVALDPETQHVVESW